MAQILMDTRGPEIRTGTFEAGAFFLPGVCFRGPCSSYEQRPKSRQDLSSVSGASWALGPRESVVT